MAGITTHVLDTSRGMPGRDVAIVLEYLEGTAWKKIGDGRTNADGRAPQLVPAGHVLAAGSYRLVFDTAGYFAGLKTDTFYPRVEIQFTVRDPREHYHVPLLVAPWGYSTYRGS